MPRAYTADHTLRAYTRKKPQVAIYKPLPLWERRIRLFFERLQTNPDIPRPLQWQTAHRPAKPRCACCGTILVVGNVATISFCERDRDRVTKVVVTATSPDM